MFSVNERFIDALFFFGLTQCVCNRHAIEIFNIGLIVHKWNGGLKMLEKPYNLAYVKFSCFTR